MLPYTRPLVTFSNLPKDITPLAAVIKIVSSYENLQTCSKMYMNLIYVHLGLIA